MLGTRKVKPFWILLLQEMMVWQLHQLDPMQTICTSLKTGNQQPQTTDGKRINYTQLKNRSSTKPYWAYDAILYIQYKYKYK